MKYVICIEKVRDAKGNIIGYTLQDSKTNKKFSVTAAKLKLLIESSQIQLVQNQTTDLKDKIRGGMYGLLVGDAIGVPYEFQRKEQIPPTDNLEMAPPEGFRRSHPTAKVGAWSDDGAQALCLLDSLIECSGFDINNFSTKMFNWLSKGLWAVDNLVFDCGIQTKMSLLEFYHGATPEYCGNLNPDGKGNGALMRVLPLVLWHKGTDEELVDIAHEQCVITHGNITNHVCCALYCLIARGLLAGDTFDNSLDNAIQKLRVIYSSKPDYSAKFEKLEPDNAHNWVGKSSGYVVDSLMCAIRLMKSTKSYEELIKTAVSLGDDTDTTACIAGGLAGIMYGYNSIPVNWLNGLHETDKVDALLSHLY